MPETTLDKLLDRLPYSDGSSRRRLIAGTILVIGFVFSFTATALGIARALKETGAFAAPALIFFAGLLIYALGSIIELLSDLYVIRAAGGVLWSLTLPRRIVRVRWRLLRFALLALLYVVVVPFAAYWGILRGFFGRAVMSYDLKPHLSTGGRRALEDLPPLVRDGLLHPSGDMSEFGLNYVADRFDTPSGRRRSLRLIGRSKDIATTTTAILVTAFLVLSVVTVKTPRPLLMTFGEPDTLSTQFQSSVVGFNAFLGEGHEVYVPWLNGRRFSHSDTLSFREARQALGTFKSEAFRLSMLSFSSVPLDSLADLYMRSRALSQRIERRNQEFIVALAKEKLGEAFLTEAAIVEEQQRRNFVAAEVILLFMASWFLLLYVGYFRSLRIATLTLLEELSEVRTSSSRPGGAGTGSGIDPST